MQPGSADLTLKLKNVDPASFPRMDANMSRRVRPAHAPGAFDSIARLKVKVPPTVICRPHGAMVGAAASLMC